MRCTVPWPSSSSRIKLQINFFGATILWLVALLLSTISLAELNHLVEWHPS